MVILLHPYIRITMWGYRTRPVTRTVFIVVLGDILKSTAEFKNSYRGHWHFLNSAGDIRPFYNLQEGFKHSDMGHYHFSKSTDDTGAPHQGPHNPDVTTEWAPGRKLNRGHYSPCHQLVTGGATSCTSRLCQ